MKKTTVAVLGAIFIALLVAPKFVGNNISQDLNSTIALIDKNPVYQAKIISQSSSWFSSQAVLEIGIDLALMGMQNIDPDAPTALTFQLVFSAQHGPIIVSGDSPGLHWASWQATSSGDSLREALTFAQDKAFYAIQGKVNLLGTTHYQDTLQGFTYAGEGLLGHAEFSGLQGEGEISAQHFNYALKVAEISLENAAISTKMQGLYVTMDAQTDLYSLLQGQLYNGSSSIGMAAFEFVDVADSAKTTLSQLELSTLSTVDNKNNTGNLQLLVTSAAYQSTNVTGSDLAMTTEFNNISGDFIKAYQVFYTNLAEQEPEQLAELMQGFMQDKLLTLLQSEPEFNFPDIHGVLNDGHFKGSLHSKVVGVQTLPDNLADISFWLSHVKADADIVAAKNVAHMIAEQIIMSQLAADPSLVNMSQQEKQNIAIQQAPAMLQGMTQQGLLQATDDNYRMTFSMENGTATLNGQPMPLPIQ